MTDWNPEEPVTIPVKTMLAVLCLCAGLSAAAFLLLWGRL